MKNDVTISSRNPGPSTELPENGLNSKMILLQLMKSHKSDGYLSEPYLRYQNIQRIAQFYY